MHAEQTVGRLRIERAVVRDAVREDVGDRHLERDRENIEAGEHVFARWPACAGDAAEIVPVQIDEVEDALLVELIGIVELAGDDASAVRQRVDEGIDERLIVQTDFTARRIARVVARERAELVDEPVGLRTVVVRQHGEISAEDDVVPIAAMAIAIYRHRCRSCRRCPSDGSPSARCG